MVKVRVSEVISVERHLVWSELARIEDHVEWMTDATAIRFLGATRSGVGTRFECDTKVGPIRLTDVMEITEWENAETMRSSAQRGRQRVGPFHPHRRRGAGHARRVGGAAQLSVVVGVDASGRRLAKPVFTALWKGNLRRLGRRITADDTRSRRDPGTRRTLRPGTAQR